MGEPKVSHCYQCYDSSVDLLRCSKCKTAVYCSRECQRENWPAHKLVCTANLELSVADINKMFDALFDNEVFLNHVSILAHHLLKDTPSGILLCNIEKKPNGFDCTLVMSKNFPKYRIPDRYTITVMYVMDPVKSLGYNRNFSFLSKVCEQMYEQFHDYFPLDKITKNTKVVLQLDTNMHYNPPMNANAA